MKEIKILAVVAALVAVTYYGIEPYAHHVMHPEPAPADYKFSDLKNVDTNVKGNAENGKALVEANCIACHSIESDGFPQMMGDADAAAAYGVTPPDLSLAGRIYEENFLANFIYDPVTATNLTHKYGPETGKAYPMPAYNWMSAQDIMDMVAYLQAIAAKEEVTKKDTFEAACVRCHSMGYAGITAQTPDETLKGYIGAAAPDLSQYIKSRGRHYLENFINDPQRLLHGTGMPRVGLTEEAQTEVIDYMEEIGDSKKEERETLGMWVLLYMVIFAVLATLWKKQIWRDVH